VAKPRAWRSRAHRRCGRISCCNYNDGNRTADCSTNHFSPLADVEAALDVLAAHGIRFGRIPTYGSHDVALTAGKPQMLAELHN
jgi:hypothetical protein